MDMYCLVCGCRPDIALTVFKSPYLGWDASAPETAVIRVGAHAMEWIFVRTAPLVLLGGIVGAFLTRKKE